MTYGECKKTALAVVDEYSSSAAPYSSDVDMLAKIPLFANSGLVVLGTLKPRTKIAYFHNPETGSGTQPIHNPETGLDEFALPADFWRYTTILGPGSPTITYDGKLAVDSEGSYSLHYESYPTQVNATTPDNTVLDLDEDAGAALPFYIAAQLLLSDGDKSWVNPQSRFDAICGMLSAGKAKVGGRVVGGVCW